MLPDALRSVLKPSGRGTSKVFAWLPVHAWLNIITPASVLPRANEVIEQGCFLLRCISPLMAPFGHDSTSALWSLSGVKRHRSNGPKSTRMVESRCDAV